MLYLLFERIRGLQREDNGVFTWPVNMFYAEKKALLILMGNRNIFIEKIETKSLKNIRKQVKYYLIK